MITLYLNLEFNIKKKPSAKPEKCNYWTRCLPDLLKQSTLHLLQEQGGTSSVLQSTEPDNQPLISYQIGTKFGWKLILGADHSKGAWKSLGKVYTADYPTRSAQEEGRKICWTERKMDHKCGYFLLRHGHID